MLLKKSNELQVCRGVKDSILQIMPGGISNTSKGVHQLASNTPCTTDLACERGQQQWAALQMPC